MDEMDVKCEGNMTLSPNSLPADKMFYVTVYTQPVYDVWNSYKQAYNCDYILNLNSSIPGDVDGDGEITAADIMVIYNYLLNNDTTFLSTSDVDGDGEITAADIMVIYNILLGN